MYFNIMQRLTLKSINLSNLSISLLFSFILANDMTFMLKPVMHIIFIVNNQNTLWVTFTFFKMENPQNSAEFDCPFIAIF